MLPHFLHAFASVLGYIFAIILTIIIYKLWKRVNAPVWAWELYIDTLINDEDYLEANRISLLLKGKGKYDKIRTPAGYKVHKKPNLDLEDRYDNMTFVVSESYIFTSKKYDYKKGFQVKLKD